MFQHYTTSMVTLRPVATRLAGEGQMNPGIHAKVNIWVWVENHMIAERVESVGKQGLQSF
jgi:hypothetical protein